MPKICVGKSGVSVYISAQSYGFLSIGGVRDAYTNSDGCCYIDFSGFGESYQGKIVVDGQTIYEGEIHENKTYRA